MTEVQQTDQQLDQQTEQHWYKYYYDELSGRFFFSIDEVVACYGIIGFFDVNNYISLLNDKMGVYINNVKPVADQNQKVDYTDYVMTDESNHGKNLINRLFTSDAKKGLVQKISEQLQEYSLNMIEAQKTRQLDAELQKISSYIYCFNLSSEQKTYLEDHTSVPDDSAKINKFTVYKVIKSSMLGKGGQGVVYKCVANNFVGDKSAETYDCIAKMIVYKNIDAYSKNKEAHVLKYITEKGNCSDVIQYIDSFCSPGDPETFYIISEFAKCEELIVMIKNGLTFEESLVMAEKLANALKCMNTDYVTHRDIKPNNVIVAYNCEKNIPESERKDLSLLNQRIKIKVLDLGLGCVTNKETPPPYDGLDCDTEQVGTLPYFPPPVRDEDIENSSLEEITELHGKGDVASLGYTLVDLFYALVDNDIDINHRFMWSYETYGKNYKYRYPEYENLRSDIWDLISKMITKDTRKDVLDINGALAGLSGIKTKLQSIKSQKGGYKKLYAINKMNYSQLIL
ncbi:serine/threonine protein kinase [Yasminevirus sp. GU-2018]|uniref:Serine/threonine protein kinase n=1 Tax=Yasminevirus sp. GU-2018 TaxID=2420051 RepID=A0A5K0UAF3_9VIRU|nr:serine/threonine protein kinase [Yasminevirus sp. GU-2018]